MFLHSVCNLFFNYDYVTLILFACFLFIFILAIYRIWKNNEGLEKK